MAGAGNVILVSYGEENKFLNDNPEISFFKIIYRRYTNFAMETTRCDFIYSPNFDGKYTLQIPKTADLIIKPWLIINLPEIPMVYDKFGNIDNKLKTAWAIKIGYRLINNIEFVINNKVIQKTWGEYMNMLDEYNIHNFNSSLNPHIGNIPLLYDYMPTTSVRAGYTLHIPILFFFYNNNQALPLLSLNNSEISINVTFHPVNMCVNISPTNFINIQNYYGTPIFGEPLIQYSPYGIAHAAFDSMDMLNNMSMQMYYRKISDHSFLTTDPVYYDNYSFIDIMQKYFNYSNPTNYYIYGLWSKSLIVPVSNSNTFNNNIENTYIYTPFLKNLSLGLTYILYDSVFLTKEERSRYHNNTQEIIVEQVYYTSEQLTNSTSSKNNIELVNPCKYTIFMAQMSYLNNVNVNDAFNYSNTWVRDRFTNQETGIPLLKSSDLFMNSKTITDTHDPKFYSKFIPFLKFPKCKNSNSISIYNFNLYPFNMQQSGSINTSRLSNIYFINTYHPTDINNIKYYFKSYFVGINVLKITHGIGNTIYYSMY